jgi:hypothetical protein
VGLPFAGEPDIGKQPIVETREALKLPTSRLPIRDKGKNRAALAQCTILGNVANTRQTIDVYGHDASIPKNRCSPHGSI